MKITPEKKLNEILPPEIMNEEDGKDLTGTHNWIIRIGYYITKGLDILNLFRNLFLGIVALYLALKLDNLWIAIAMFPPSFIILAILGRYSVHSLAKRWEWLGIRFSTHYGLKAFNYQESQAELLTEIRDLLLEQKKARQIFMGSGIVGPKDVDLQKIFTDKENQDATAL